jgi:8-oxo-dGTP diphosphatase
LHSKQLIEQEFGGRIRVRVCGICENDGRFLLANHLGINENGNFWCPPGGGIEFGETIENALKREYLEETGLGIELVEFLGIYEYLKQPLHAIELFYRVTIIDGELVTGFDPETGNQILKEVKWIGESEIYKLENAEIHQYFHKK